MAEGRPLRGYDSYRVTLGDEMRGERASLGKSLLDVQRDLRIRAEHIDAIERCDPDGIPFKGFVTGYVRAYARYLGMDEDDVLRRFCAESGFAPAVSIERGASAEKTARPVKRDDLDAVIAGSRLAAASRAESLGADFGATLRGVSSLAVLAALVGGLGYGGWALLQNIQRVDFAPLSMPPSALAQTPRFEAPPFDTAGADVARVAQAGVGPTSAIDPDALAALYAVQEVEPPRLTLRDGPIAALDPARAGVYAPPPQPEVASDPGAAPGASGSPSAEAVMAAPDAPAPGLATAPAVDDALRGVALVFAEEAWVRVRDASGVVLFEGLAPAGQSWRAPVRTEGLTVRAGNAGGVFVEVDGQRFGPLGARGAVVSNVPLDPESVRTALPAVPRLPAEAGPTRSAAAAP